ncbi:MAG: hypothetical protein ACOYN0_19830 [Phycisphaerales bacterium]
MNTRSSGLAMCAFLAIANAGCGQRQAPIDAADSVATRPPSRPWLSPDLTSGLDIPASQRFIFAGGQSKPFTAFVTNRGEVPVQIFAELDGTSMPIGTVEPGGTVSHRFGEKQAAVFENASGQQASLRVEVWGQTQVGMRYLPMMTDAK